jgi:transcriptional regulator with PAS, ATPase and Fis domain
LSGAPLYVGKQQDFAIVLDDPAVSRRHLELRSDRFGVIARDCGSKNGSFYRGARFSEILLGAGAVVTVGTTQLRVVRAEEGVVPEAATTPRFGRMIGPSLIMRRLFAELQRIASSYVPVLIEGETGTGKELCAEAIHLASARATRPYGVCDLSEISRTLIESELFGHVKGAFTGAASNRAGVFDVAHTGSVFLDELGELELEQQPRLLRVIENQTIRPVGSSKYHKVDVRVIAATNRDLAQEVAAGRFREDLYYRLTVLRVRLPALRERKEDIPALVASMLDPHGVTASPEVLELLAEHDWPGNVRELRNVIERGLVYKRTANRIDADALGIVASEGSAKRTQPADYHEQKRTVIDGWERSFLERMLKACDGSMTEAARRCGLGRAHFYRLAKRHELKP